MIPPSSVLAAVDFSAPSRVALTFAMRLARQSHADLRVLHALNPLVSAAARAEGIDLLAQTREELDAFVRSCGPVGHAAVRTHVKIGPGAPTICDIADRDGADVVVMGMHGMSGAARLMFGSTTEGVLRLSQVPIILVPEEWSPPAGEDLTGTGPVIVGIDLCLTSLDAACAGQRLAAMCGTHMELVHVVPELPVLERWKPHAESAVSERVAHAKRELSAATRGLRHDVPFELRVDTGPVAERLAMAAMGADGPHPLLVLGRRARETREGAPGATASRVVSLARVPVMVYIESR